MLLNYNYYSISLHFLSLIHLNPFSLPTFDHLRYSIVPVSLRKQRLSGRDTQLSRSCCHILHRLIYELFRGAWPAADFNCLAASSEFLDSAILHLGQDFEEFD